MNEVVSTPIIDATLTNNSTLSTMLAKLAMKPCKVRSTRRMASRRLTRPVSTLISHQPTARVINARVTLPLYSSNTGTQASERFSNSSTFISTPDILFHLHVTHVPQAGCDSVQLTSFCDAGQS